MSLLQVILIISSFLLVSVSCFNILTTYQQRTSNRFVSMKGKGGKVPINQRGEFMKRQKIMEAQNALTASKPEGVPIFKVFVRPKTGGIWIPCGDLAGDEKAKSLVESWMNGFMADMSKSTLDQGIARSIFAQEESFAKSIIENLKPFKKFAPSDLEFGYKIEFSGLEEKVGEQKIKPIVRGMEKSWIDNVKDGFGGIFGGKK